MHNLSQTMPTSSIPQHNSTQELVLIIAVCIGASFVICCCIVFCVYYMKHIKSSKRNKVVEFVKGADAIQENVNKNKVNLDNVSIKNNDGNAEIDITNESLQSDEDEELYDHVDIVETPDKLTSEGGDKDEYNSEGVPERNQCELNGNIHNEGKKGSLKNVAECVHNIEKTNDTTNTTANDGSDDPGFV